MLSSYCRSIAITVQLVSFFVYHLEDPTVEKDFSQVQQSKRILGNAALVKMAIVQINSLRPFNNLIVILHQKKLLQFCL